MPLSNFAFDSLSHRSPMPLSNFRSGRRRRGPCCGASVSRVPPCRPLSVVRGLCWSQRLRPWSPITLRLIRKQAGIMQELRTFINAPKRRITFRNSKRGWDPTWNYHGIILELWTKILPSGGEARKKGTHNSTRPFGLEPNGKWNYGPKKLAKTSNFDLPH